MNKQKYFYLILAFYHLFFTLIAYNYFIKNGGDANLYWYNNVYTDHKVWIDFLYPGADFICLINYPLVKFFHLPIWGGFVLYSFIGYLAIIQFVRWVKIVIPNPISYKNFNLVLLIAFLPSLHFWTSILGKEPLILLGITSFILELSKSKANTFKIIMSLLLVSLIRPHIAILLIICFMVYFILFKTNTLKDKIILVLSSTIIFIFSVITILKISKIKRLDIDRILRFNKFSKLSKSDSNSYVALENYSTIEQWFTFYFRPLFYDSKTFLSTFVSVENLFVLLLHLITLFFFIRYFKKIKVNFIYWSIILYYIIFALVFIQRYSILGLIVRTKIMSQPFILVFLIYILTEAVQFKKIKKQANE